MKVLVYSTKQYDLNAFHAEFDGDDAVVLDFTEAHLTPTTAPLAKGYDAVCAFVNDDLSHTTLGILHERGVRTIAMRCAGYNNVDMEAAKAMGIRVLRVPAYSPYAVAEHALALILTLNRKTHKAYNRVRENNFLLEGLVGHDVHGKTVGVIGTGKIGQIFAGIMKGMGCDILAYDPYPNDVMKQYGARYVELPELYAHSDMISLHCPLMPETHHLINSHAVAQLKQGVMLINTSRGGLIDTVAVTEGLRDGTIGALGLDVYEEEGDLFFENLSEKVIQDETFLRLLTFPNVLVTGHQAFLTHEALQNIARTTHQNLNDAAAHKASDNEVT
jgi:D-lactate dehydrogenase